MIAVVLDTNVLVAAMRSSLGSSFALLSTLGDGRWQPVVSPALALEYEDVLKREASGIALATGEIDDVLNYLFLAARLVRSVPRLRPTLSDADDDRILEVAVRGNAEIVTFNVRDFREASRLGVGVSTPRAFLSKLGALP